MLRLVFVFGIIGVFSAFAVQSPFYALLFYLWLSYFRPEQWVWSGIVTSLNLQLIVGTWLVLFAVISRPKIRFGIGPALMFLLLLQGLVSTMFSQAPDWAWRYWVEFAKALLIGYLMIVLTTTEERLRAVLVVIALSLGFEGAKQGWAQLILNPGARNDNHWPVLGDNNGVAIGMLMLLSMLVALIRTSSSRWHRHAGHFLAVGVTYRAISTYSRGGFLACGALVLLYLVRSRRRLPTLVGIGLAAAIVLPVLPQTFWERMSTIQSTAEGEYLDHSTAGRLHYWQVAIAVANDHPLLGVGQNAYYTVYNRYDWSTGLYGRFRSVHSQWFGMLAELGYPGLFFFVANLAWALIICWRNRILARRHPELQALGHYSTGIEGALVAAAVGGTFYPFQYNEMLWHTIALATVTGRLMQVRVAELARAVEQRSLAPVPVSLAVARRTSV